MSTRENTVTTVVGVGVSGRQPYGGRPHQSHCSCTYVLDSLQAQLAAQAAVIEAAREVVKVDYGNPFIERYAPLHRLKSVLAALDGAPG